LAELGKVNEETKTIIAMNPERLMRAV